VFVASEPPTRTRVSRKHRIDFVGLDQEGMDWGQGPQRRGAAACAEHGQFTDDVTSARGRDLFAVHQHRGLTIDEDEPVRLSVALTAELVADPEVPIDQELGDVIDLPLRAALEEVDLSDQGTLLGGFELLDGLTSRERGTSNVAVDYEPEAPLGAR
jgi:hypothetical protein